MSPSPPPADDAQPAAQLPVTGAPARGAVATAPTRWRVLVIVLVGAVIVGGLIAMLLARPGPAAPAAAGGEAAVDALRTQTARRIDELLDRIDQLNGEVEALRNQRVSLEQMVAEITQGRDEVVLHEVERLLVIAQQDLQVAASPAAAIGALETAEQRLARASRPQFVALRRAVQRDLERLRAAPAFDLAAQVSKLDQLAAGAEAWPLLAEPAAGLPGAADKSAAARERLVAEKGVADRSAGERSAKAAPKAAPDEPDFGERLRAWLEREFGDLVRIQRADAPEALLLPASQQRLVRLQLKLRLLGARYALLTRNEPLLREEVAGAQSLLARYYDPRHAATAAAIAQIKQLAAASAPVKAPALSESFAALAVLRRESR